MLSIDSSLFVVFIVVWILVVLLTKYFFNPLQKVMEKRDAEVKQNIQITQRILEDYERTIQEIEEAIQAAKVTSSAIREKFEKETLKEKELMLAEISLECRSKVEEAKIHLDSQLEKLKKEFQSQSRDFADQIVRRLLS